MFAFTFFWCMKRVVNLVRRDDYKSQLESSTIIADVYIGAAVQSSGILQLVWLVFFFFFFFFFF